MHWTPTIMPQLQLAFLGGAHSYANQVVTGTERADTLALDRDVTTNVDTFGGNDVVTLGGAADFNVELGSGHDRLTIDTTGDVTAYGGDGLDRFFVNVLNGHHIDGGAGSDILDFRGMAQGVNVYMASGGVTENYNGSDPYLDPTMTFENVESVHGSEFGDRIQGDNDGNRLYGHGGEDQLSCGNGNDIVDGGTEGDTISLGGGNDIGYGGAGPDLIYGSSGNDRLYGQAGRDTLSGGRGDDILIGGDGSDQLYGGEGHDTVSGGAGHDTVFADRFDSGNDVYNGGEDPVPWPWSSTHVFIDSVDTLDYSEATGSLHLDAELGLASGVAAGVPIMTQAGPFTITEEFVDTFYAFERYVGTAFDDTFRASDAETESEYFVGGDGDDLFHASRGSDHFDGAFSESWIEDDTGFDTVDYSDYGASVEVDLGAGEGIVNDAETGSYWTHTYEDIEGVVGTAYNDILIGDDEDNRLDGGTGGWDTLTGDGGADIFAFDGSGGTIGRDRIIDFDEAEDLLELAGLSRIESDVIMGVTDIDGTPITGFADLDTNGDGFLSAADTAMDVSGGNATLLFVEGRIELQNVTELTADDFVFV